MVLCMDSASEFDWDSANVAHIARHQVLPSEVEEAFANNPLLVLATQLRGGEERMLCAGPTNEGRALQFVYTVRDGRIRVVTAHSAARKVRGKL